MSPIKYIMLCVYNVAMWYIKLNTKAQKSKIYLNSMKLIVLTKKQNWFSVTLLVEFNINVVQTLWKY